MVSNSQQTYDFILGAIEGRPVAFRYQDANGVEQSMSTDGEPPKDLWEYVKMLPAFIKAIDNTVGPISPELTAMRTVFEGLNALAGDSGFLEQAQGVVNSAAQDMDAQRDNGPVSMAMADTAKAIGDALKKLSGNDLQDMTPEELAAQRDRQNTPVADAARQRGGPSL